MIRIGAGVVMIVIGCLIDVRTAGAPPFPGLAAAITCAAIGYILLLTSPPALKLLRWPDTAKKLGIIFLGTVVAILCAGALFAGMLMLHRRHAP
jgi:hypothetical protein